MSLNWKEIDLVLEELELGGCRIQKVYQSAYDVLVFHLYGKGRAFFLLIALTPGACRLHETKRGAVKADRPLRFAEFCKSRLVNGVIEEAVQLGNNRIVRLLVRQGKNRYRCYIRLWSNAANVIVSDVDGVILDVMRRSPKRGEITGGRYEPEATERAEDAAGKGAERPGRKADDYAVRELPGPLSFNERIDAWYAEHGGALSLDALREQARRSFGGRIDRLELSLERLRTKEADYAASDRFREYGDIIMANLDRIRPGDEWLEAENFYSGGLVRIRLDPKKKSPAQAESYYEQYRKAKSGLEELRREIAAGETELAGLRETLESLLREENPLVLHKRLKNRGERPARSGGKRRPGLSFRRGDWLIVVGRDAAENDALLRGHVKGRDLWLHTRDYAGSYVFVKQRAGKTVPLDILLDAGNLALFYSKARNNGEADLFYTQVKFLRRAKNGPKGLVIPTQEKNLHIRADPVRLRELEKCRQ
ncbi:MAG: NFACT RNA binding domain-containing protein [Treponema sp.]|jgi:predicted ribosome quality control (RQC) complex YloA/Tae2 family protein|nr:NFACT RNA binding domain-containing protein [Treponema sp.]